MTSFRNLFHELFKQRSNLIWLFFLLQILIALVGGLMSFSQDSHITIRNFQWGDFFVASGTIFLFLGLIYDLLFVILTAYRNEKINQSQTWRLIPASSGKIYLTNLFSSFMALVGLALLQIVSAGVLFGLAEISSAAMRQDTAKLFANINWRWDRDQTNAVIWIVGTLIFLILLSILLYAVTSFINFSSSSIINFLPSVSGKFALLVTRLLLIIVISWVIIRVINIFNFANISLVDTQRITIFDLVLLVINLIFLAANVLMINKTFEAEPNK
ncbi:hypothetical protein PT285_05995 [Lactobacillus sp. ESL0791]|uniref:hypothetical protein n=1 Tax=Lactobacillus sp. ESL0791 TaxID=2983234 RepID=UPI0023F6FE01|nr:hypothetical protein [Lactobacillus sp. ESL0791]MDF7638950.1 hypothetical protein [Lactobacillus sp. ESL0791]